MKPKTFLFALGTSIVFTASAHAVTDTVATGVTDLTAGASWVDTTAPVVADPSIIQWTGTSAGTGLTLGSAATWYGMNIQGSADAAIGITGAGAITLGSGGIKIESTGVNTSIGNAIALGSNQTWSAASGKTLTVSGIVLGTGPLIIGAASQTSQTFLNGTVQTLFTNVNLSDLIATGGMMGGAYVAANNNLLGGGYLLNTSASPVNYWLESQDGTLVKGVKIELAQSGSDITTKATNAKYATGSLGYDFNATGNAGTLATTDASNGYGGHTTTLITKSSAYTGTVSLTGNNTFSGGLVAASGTTSGAVGVSYDGSQGGSFGAGSITVHTGATLTSGAAFVIGGGQNNTRVLNINGGSIDIKSAGAGGEYLRTINITGGSILSSDGGGGGSTSDWFRAPNGGITLNALASAITSTISTRIDLTLGNLAIDVADGAAADDLSISGNITENTGAGGGARTLTKNGAGTLQLSGTCSYSGTTSVNAGTLKLGTGGNITNSSITITPGALFDITAAGYTLPSGKTLTAGRTTTPATDIAGNLTVSGNLKPATDGAIGTLTTTGALNLGGTLYLDRNAGSNASDTIAINGALTVQSGLVVNLNAIGTPAAGIRTYTIVSGATSIVDAANLPAVPGFTWDSTSDPTKLKLVQSGSNLTWKGNISSDWDYATANWNNGVSGTSFIDGDFVTIDDTASGSGAFTVNIPADITPGSIVVNNSTARDCTIESNTNLGIIGSTSVAKTGNGLLNLLSNNLHTGGTILSAGTLNFGVNGLGAISGTNTMGALTMDGGTLRWNTANTQDISSHVVMVNGKTATFDTNGNDITFAAAIGNAASAAMVKSGTGILTLTKAASYTGTTTVNAGTLLLDSSSIANNGSILASSIIHNSATVKIYRNATGGLGMTSSLSGSGDFIIDGPGGGSMYDYRVCLRGPASDNTGTIRVVNTGKLWVDVASSNAIGDTSVVDVGPNAKFYIYQGITETIGALSGSGNVYGGDATTSTSNLIVGGGDHSATFSGTMQNSGSTLTLTKIGTGTQTLSGINTYTGNTVVNAGTLELAAGAQLRFRITNTGTNSITGTGTAVLNGDFAIDTSAVTTGTGPWLVENVSTLTGSYGSTFRVVNPDGSLWTNAGNDKWTKPATGGKVWTFDETTGTLTLATGGFSSWANANAPGQTIDQDHDNDGVPNGVEYFMGLSGSGFTANPTLDSTRKVSWPKGTNYNGVYGTDYVIQTSGDLSNWSNVPVENVTNGNSLEYTLPLDADKKFTRLKVTGP